MQTTETDLHLKMSLQKLGPQVKLKQHIFRVMKEIVGIQCHQMNESLLLHSDLQKGSASVTPLSQFTLIL